MEESEPIVLGFHHWLAIGGGALALLCVVMYLIPKARIKIPAIIGVSLGFLAAGAGLGIAAMTVMGYHWDKQPAPASAGPAGGMAAMRPGGGGGGMMGGGGGGMMGGGGGGGMMGCMMGGGGRGGGGRGGMGPNSKNQLAQLVTKLDQLTAKPLKLELTDDQKKKVAESIKGLAEAETISEEDAKKKLDDLLKVVEKEKETLETAGYRWPGAGGPGGGFRPPPDVPNPFKDGDNNKHLKGLQERVAVAKTK
jgi:hypothetical protein